MFLQSLRMVTVNDNAQTKIDLQETIISAGRGKYRSSIYVPTLLRHLQWRNGPIEVADVEVYKSQRIKTDNVQG
jgi:hypothetical protein